MTKIVIYDNKGLVHSTIEPDWKPIGILEWIKLMREIYESLQWAFNSDLAEVIKALNQMSKAPPTSDHT